MEKMELLAKLGQAKNEDISEVFNEFVRSAARYAVLEAMSEEVALLCGPRHTQQSKRTQERGGTAPDSIFVGAESEDIKRPRVRKRTEDGTKKEVTLDTYKAAQDGTVLKEAMMKALIAGVSSRKQSDLVNNSKGSSKSSVSRIWQKKGKEYVMSLRSRTLEEDGYVVLMMDGIHLGDTITAVVALGITSDGKKHMLDFEIGSSENNEICDSLMDRLVERGFKPNADRLYCVLDGGKALRHGIRKYWPDALIQTCLVHVCRRIKGRLSKKFYMELEAGFKSLREASKLDAACEAYYRLKSFVAKHSAEGLNTLENAKEEMLTLHWVGAPDTLNKSLLSSNSIENSIRNMRGVLGRVTKWKSNTDMPSYWLSGGMLEAEKGFHRINGYQDIPLLIKALNLAPSEREEDWDKPVTKKA
jgi:transposase-like protein